MNISGCNMPTKYKFFTNLRSTNSIFVVSRFVFFSYFVGIIFLLNSCKKDKEKVYDYVYNVNDEYVNQTGVNKPNVKSTLEFISIAYSDLFGTTIGQGDLTNLSLAYIAFGDRKFIEDMIIRNFLNKSGVIIPTKSEMTADVQTFVKNTYRKFYNRDPNEFEKWQIVNNINSDANATPELVYYAFMTSDEYRYY